MRVINVVRRKEQVDILKEDNAEAIVLDSSEEGFEAKLASVCKEHSAKICFDAVYICLFKAVTDHVEYRSC